MDIRCDMTFGHIACIVKDWCIRVCEAQKRLEMGKSAQDKYEARSHTNARRLMKTNVHQGRRQLWMGTWCPLFFYSFLFLFSIIEASHKGLLPILPCLPS